jgi:Zn-dependent protease with chaperone function
MNFYDRQKRAKRNSRIFIALFAACFLAVVFAIWYVFANLIYAREIVTPLFLYAITPARTTFEIVFVASNLIGVGVSYMASTLKGDGNAVAKRLNGRLIDRASSDFDEKRLVNIVDEISLACGVESPNVYILDNEGGINAFVAGEDRTKSAIGLTKGAMKYLNRDELQGVIAHEFSHFINEDSKLNMQAICWLYGLNFICYIGTLFFGRSKNSDSMRETGFFGIIGAIFVSIGVIGWVFASIAKAALNREREYLADALAVQFTRNPDGIASALKKIGGLNSSIRALNAPLFSHFFFASGAIDVFDTHPPLKDRIRRIEPSWDGRFIVPKRVKKDDGWQPRRSLISWEDDEMIHNLIAQKQIVGIKRDKAQKIAKTAPLVFAQESDGDFFGEAGAKSLCLAKEDLEAIPTILREKAADPITARWAIYALLRDAENEKIAEIRRRIIEERVYDLEFDIIDEAAGNLERPSYVHLIFLCLPALKRLSFDQYVHFKETVERLIHADGKVSLFEFNLKYLAIYPLDICFGLRKTAKPIYANTNAIAKDIAMLLSAIVCDQFKNDEKAKLAFDRISRTFGEKLEYINADRILTETLERSYDAAQKTDEATRKKIVQMAIACVESDGKISVEEAETIHALRSALGLGYL